MTPSTEAIKTLRGLLDELTGPGSREQWTFLEGQARLQQRVREFGAPLEPSAGLPVLLHITGDKENARGDLIDTDRDVRGVVVSDRFRIVPWPDADLGELLEKLHKYTPRVLHIAAHGDPSGAPTLRTERISVVRLSPVLRLVREHLRLLVLGACHSDAAIEQFDEVVRFAIGFRGQADDEWISRFCRSFYISLSPSTTIPEAFDAAVGVVGDRVSPRLVIGIPSLLVHLADHDLIDDPFFDALERRRRARGRDDLKDKLLDCQGLWRRELRDAPRAVPAPSEPTGSETVRVDGVREVLQSALAGRSQIVQTGGLFAPGSVFNIRGSQYTGDKNEVHHHYSGAPPPDRQERAEAPRDRDRPRLGPGTALEISPLEPPERASAYWPAEDVRADGPHADVVEDRGDVIIIRMRSLAYGNQVEGVQGDVLVDEFDRTPADAVLHLATAVVESVIPSVQGASLFELRLSRPLQYRPRTRKWAFS